MKMVLVSDFDENLFNTKIINNFIDKGNIFIIATGKTFRELKRQLPDDLKFSFIICNNGGMIFDENLDLIYRSDINDKYVSNIFNSLNQSIYVGTPLIDLGYCHKHEICNTANCIFARVIDKEKTDLLVYQLLREHKEICAYIDNNNICFASLSASKVNAVKYIGKIIKVNPRKMIFIGSTILDMSMCKLGKSYALEGSDEGLVKVCKKTIKKIDELNL